ncbi:MAG TPA: tetratricopeptide repeat protein [Thermoanaerobaculia bacterium]|nr:tetratricopeptide repeat protein [Thermoanaerobaculia bacterium]
MRRSLALTVVLLAFAANAFAVGQARITGKIVDAVTKNPIPDAVVTVKAVEGKSFNQNYKAKKDGTYAIFLLDGTLRYEFSYAAPGYRPFVEVMKLRLGEPNVRDIELMSQAALASATVPAAEIRIDPAVAAYNEGAALANEGKNVEAVAKFEEALAAKPELIQGWQALAKLSVRTKNYDRAIAAAEKALAADSEDPDMFAVLYEAYSGKGDKAKAAEYKTKMPANPGLLFNDAARAINAGRDREAEPLLRQAIAADESFAPAYYELGMLYVRSGKNAEARQSLLKYIELDPNGRDAATAKEMLNYVK